MKMVASCTRFKDRDTFSEWLSHLPKKFSLDYRSKILKIMIRGDRILWTQERGIKIL